jgi:hypothetical protein
VPAEKLLPIPKRTRVIGRGVIVCYSLERIPCMTNLARILALGCLFAVGCDVESPPLNDISGEVRYNGKPLPNAILNFVPAAGRPGQSLTDTEGKFPHVVYTEKRNGLMTGDYQVLVAYNPTAPPQNPSLPPEIPEEWHPLLIKYGDYNKPKLNVTIEQGQKTLTLELKDD